MPCRTGCKTQDHASYSQCARAATIGLGATETRNAQMAELNAYASARSQGIQPATTHLADTRAAVEISEKVGRPWDATSGSFKN